MGFFDFAFPALGGLSGIKEGYNWLTSNKGDTQAGKDREMVNPFLQQGSPYINTQQGTSPQQGNYNALIQMLQQRANGQGPSLAGNAYQQASDDAMAKQMAMSNSGNPAAARQAAMNLGGIQQGLASGLATARNQEMMGASSQLGSAISGADTSSLAREQMAMQRERANQEAWLNMLAQRLGLTRQQMTGKTNADMLGGIIQGAGQAIASA